VIDSKKVLKFVDNNLNGLVSQLQTLIRQPSVSAKNEGIEECAKLVAKIMKKSGISSEILRLKKGIAPVVYGEVSRKKILRKQSYSIIIMMSNLPNLLISGMMNHLVEK